MVIGTDIRSEISTSKIMKFIAIMKNRDENGSRAGFFWGQTRIQIVIFFLGLH